MLHDVTIPPALQATDALHVSKKVPVPVLNEDTHEAPHGGVQTGKAPQTCSVVVGRSRLQAK